MVFDLRKWAALGIGLSIAIAFGGQAHAEDDSQKCLTTESTVDSVERVGACSRLIEGGISGKDKFTAYSHRGLSYGQIGQMDSAIEDFSIALKLDKTALPMWIARSRAYFHKREHDLAMLDLAEAIKLKPDSAIAYNLMGKNHFMLGNYELALGFFDKAINIDSNFYNAFVNRATTLYRDNKLDRAIKDVNAAYLMLPPGDSRGRALLQLKVAIERARASQQGASQTTN